MLVQTIEVFTASWNQNAASFEWTKKEVHQQGIKRYFAELCNQVLVQFSVLKSELVEFLFEFLNPNTSILLLF